MVRTGSLLFVFYLFYFWPMFLVESAEVKFSVTPDRTEIAQDESVSLKFEIEVEGGRGAGGANPEFDAPDFDFINQYQSTYMESVYENGRFTARNVKRITKVLKPKKKGRLSIRTIRVVVDGKTYRASDLSIKVTAGGVGTPPPRGQSGKLGMRGSSRVRGSNRKFFLKAEVNKNDVYKGEQIIVSYYLYRQTRVFNLQAKKYPVLEGFLREDLEMPILSPQYSSETVTFNGISYQRALLARYAAYPLKATRLRVDPLIVKAHYYSNSSRNFGNDPFGGFFRQIAPQVTELKSEPIEISVKPLPTEGKLDQFSGGVGDFDVLLTADRYEVQAGQPVTLSLVIEGRGNLSGVQEPKIDWPEAFEFYESTNRSKVGKAGVNKRVFEFLLIPRKNGEYQMDPIRLSFFNPDTDSYVEKETASISLKVTGSSEQGVFPTKKLKRVQESASGETKQVDIRYLKMPLKVNDSLLGHPWWRWLYWVSILSIVFLFLFILVDRLLSLSLRKNRRQTSTDWSRRLQNLESRRNRDSIKDLYSELSSVLVDFIDKKYRVGAVSYGRRELGRILVQDHRLEERLWDELEQILDAIDKVKYAHLSGDFQDELVKKDFLSWLTRSKKWISALE